jgi:hypothetical protein
MGAVRMNKKLSPEEMEEIGESMLPIGVFLSIFLQKHHIVYLETKENKFDYSEGDDEK